MSRSKISFTLSAVLPLVACLVSCIGPAAQKAYAAQKADTAQKTDAVQKADAAPVQGFAPEVASSVWQEDEQEVASVCLNGHELISFRADKDSGAAQAKADDLASKLQDLLDDKKFDVDELIPTRSGNQAVVQVQGTPVLSFDVQTQLDQDATIKEEHSPALRVSWKLVNEIRNAFGAPTLPQEFLRLSERAGGDSSKMQKLVSCFSGTASWYGPHFHGRLTSDGHRFDQEKLTAAHRSLPFGTKLLVMNRKTGATCVVLVNDRGPFVGDRVIDLSRGAARQLNMLSDGVAPVACLVLGTTN